MNTLITDGIEISVEAFYQKDYSRPSKKRYVFSYRVRIFNFREDSVQLLRRKWHIFDSAGFIREVEGEGVIGEQPILPPEGSHEYESWCPLTTPIGKMDGSFLMVSLETNETFSVLIPEFRLIAPFKLN
ncbi:MAG: Co2+/Mg2+ efflux protein ApaG [Saprospiraceae bacterium]|nr:Co2+/Mg2+ efflux protein ApaG [Saprospiraceae bacterium]MCB9324237.1 Co2+/Mg2+ efflux protein ApaG [Lewinellaceae bacterium]